MSTRLPSGLVVAALLRRVNDAGGLAVVRARGDPQAGALLLVLEREARVVERGIGPDGRETLIDVGPRESGFGALDEFCARRRRNDPDLWVIALDIAESERFAAETILSN